MGLCGNGSESWGCTATDTALDEREDGKLILKWAMGCLHPVVYHDLWYSGRQHNNENKPTELFTLVLFNKRIQIVDGDYRFLRTVGVNLPNYTRSQPGRP
jgi:hypothetical protein